jgi:type I restriction enzyme M protein
MNQQALSSFIWSVADLLRGDYKQSDYGKVILPFTVLRRLDCILEATKAAVSLSLLRRHGLAARKLLPQDINRAKAWGNVRRVA